VLEQKSTTKKDVKPNTPVVCSNDGQFATVDKMEGTDAIKLKPDSKGVVHYIPMNWVTKVDDKVHVDRPGEQAMREWTTTPQSTAGTKVSRPAESAASSSTSSATKPAARPAAPSKH
jgi:hypothetical protein